MDTAKVRSLAQEILALPDPERQELAREVLPALLGTRAGLEEIDEALRELPDAEVRALDERARRRAARAPATPRRRRHRDGADRPQSRPDDDKFLECAITGSADDIVRADLDLLALREAEGILGIKQPHVSLMRGRSGAFSVERLMQRCP